MKALEFSRILEELAARTSCQLGRELALEVKPLSSLPAIQRVQQETAEARAILSEGRTVPFGGIRDIRIPVERAANGGVLTPEQLQAVADTIYGCRQLHRFLQERAGTAPLIGRYAAQFGQFDAVEEEIRRCIEPGGVSSSASRTLKEIRREVAALQARIQDRLNGMLRQLRPHLQEALITTRSGRWVIPVKASSRAAVPGTVHGASASGATLFVEPDAVRHLADELENWRAMEEEEVTRILVALSGLVAGKADQLAAALDAVAELDLIFARAKLSLAWSAEPVTWNQEGLVELKGARHPLLGKAAVGNTIRMSPEQRMLIVTGPNTGGKTLLLKTLGLLVLMARCGLHIPVEPGSRLCFFDQVFADIGDQQSLEQSLSTFSGHIANVAPMLEQAGPRTLVLLDELGSGTDPAEGTALGVALLEAFLARGAYTLVTTHLREIKEFGQVTPSCAIAGMGFDGDTLQPTYRLIYGALGESQGLAIAARVGLPPEVVARAREVLQANLHGAAAGPKLSRLATTRAGGAAPEVRSHGGSLQPSPGSQPVSSGGRLHGLDRGAESGVQPLVLEPVSARRCRVWTGSEERELPLTPALRREHPAGLLPGDRVQLWQGQIAGVAPHASVLACRDADTFVETPVAVNVGRLLILISACRPDFHPGVLARHLLWAEHSGVAPVILLSKADLVSKGEAASLLKPFRSVGYQAVALDLKRGSGVDLLTDLLAEGITGVIAVPGAGKRTLLERLGCDLANSSRSRNNRSPHAVQFHRSKAGAWVLDLPDLRALGVWKPDLTVGFRDFVPYAAACAAPGCLHRPVDRGCGVQAAAAEGRLPAERIRQYLFLTGLMGLA